MPSSFARSASPIALALASTLLALASGCGSSSAPAAIPLTVFHGPQPVKVADGTMLVYELYVGDYRSRGLSVSRIDVRRDGPGGAVLRTYEGAGLAGIVVPLPDGMADRAMLLLGVTVPEGSAVPAALHHEVAFQGGLSAAGGLATVANATPVVIGPPVRGDGWYVGNGPTTLPVYHRNAIQERGGVMYGPERFAVDWVQLGADGKAFTGEGQLPEDWVSYGADLVAVADGTILDARDGIPDNRPVGAYSVPMTADNALGNYVVLDVGGLHRHFAVYAHIVPGTLQVKVNDTVSAGQVIGKLGSSGNSGAPHLHFHVCDGVGPSQDPGNAMFCDGLPFVFSSFTLLGSIDFDSVNAGVPFRPTSPPQERRGELVLGEQVVNLGP